VIQLQLNRSIAFTSSWKNTVIIGLIMAAALVFVLIFLQPFDTYGNPLPDKELKLAGYSICILLPVVGLHVPELMLYRKRGQKWFILDEIVFLLLGFLLISVLAYFYNTIVVNQFPVNWKYIWGWTMEFSLPFAPIFIPLWAYLRFRFSQVIISNIHPERSKVLTVKGVNANEEITFRDADFIMAQAQANYVDIYVLNEKGHLEKHIFRQTLSGLIDQIPAAQQIHRSFLVNIDYVDELKGNTRKGSVVIKNIVNEVPVSSKHFTGLKNYLQIRPRSSV
jgi:hypothetical protein